MKWMFYTFVVSLILTGCAHHAAEFGNPQALNENLSRQQRLQQLVELNHWNMRGLVGLMNGKQAWSAPFSWQQRGEEFKIQLYGPIAGGALNIIGKPGHVVLADTDHVKIFAHSGDELLIPETDLKIPVESIYYWIKAIAIPKIAADKKYDPYHHLIELSQLGWHIKYLDYRSDKGIDLPSKIVISNTPINIKILINRWQILQQNHKKNLHHI